MDVTPTASQSSGSTEPASVQTKKRAHEGSVRTLVTSSADGRTVEIEMTDAPSQAASVSSDRNQLSQSRFAVLSEGNTTHDHDSSE
ncbi:hypothetical protein E4U39_007933 [Claviceps sp. Clav50 group G5]|nr:hypothetical protein E4U39_007933 [Claviceps sp. Clav50 group G5]